MKKWLLSPPSLNDFLRLLNAWKLWLLGSALGALIGAAVFYLFPPMYRAKATVIVDFNIEESWTYGSDRGVFYYLEREARKLTEVAWADETVSAVSTVFPDLTVASLRGERLHLSHPEDGGWHFYADDPDSARAEEMVALWVESFVAQVRDGAVNATSLRATMLAIKEGKVRATDVEGDLLHFEENSLGLLSYVEVSPTQIDNLPIERRNSLGEYIFFGAVSTSGLVALIILLIGSGDE
jgi:pimeloyl-ACP methyl ester carboxylesterase